EDVAGDRDSFARQVAGELDRYSLEKRFRRKDGTYFWGAVTSSAVRDADGRFLYAVRIQHDIADRKRAEQDLARRMEEQAALYELTERLQHVGSADEVYEPAFDAIARALRCPRSAILLYDSAKVMRFVAWRGLSDRYRQAVEGHSPWAPEVKDPQPVCIDDVRTADLPPDLKQTVLDEGILALAFIPLVEGKR